MSELPELELLIQRFMQPVQPESRDVRTIRTQRTRGTAGCASIQQQPLFEHEHLERSI